MLAIPQRVVEPGGGVGQLPERAADTDNHGHSALHSPRHTPLHKSSPSRVAQHYHHHLVPCDDLASGFVLGTHWEDVLKYKAGDFLPNFMKSGRETGLRMP